MHSVVLLLSSNTQLLFYSASCGSFVSAAAIQEAWRRYRADEGCEISPSEIASWRGSRPLLTAN